MITIGRLKELLREIEEDHTLGAITAKEAIALVERITGYPPSIYYRIEVFVNSCGHNHHSSCTVIFAEVSHEGISLMRQRVSSCPVGKGQFCGEVDPRPVILDGEEELALFIAWGHQIIVRRGVLDLLLAKPRYPNHEYVLANSEMWTLMMLSDAIGDLVAAVKKAIIDLEATKKILKSEEIANIRRALDWALVGLRNAVSN